MAPFRRDDSLLLAASLSYQLALYIAKDILSDQGTAATAAQRSASAGGRRRISASIAVPERLVIGDSIAARPR